MKQFEQKVAKLRETAEALSRDQSTINRRKDAILKGLRIKLSNRNKFEDFPHRGSARCNLHE